MSLLAPACLLLLIPWAALALWLLTGRASTTGIPYVPLWQGGLAQPRDRQNLRLPPAAIVLLLTAFAAAVLAASHPVISVRSALLPTAAPQPIVVVVDRGISGMGAADPDRAYAHAGNDVASLLAPGFRPAFQLDFVPGQVEFTTAASLADRLSKTRPTLLDTQAALTLQIDRAIQQPHLGPVIVITDRSVVPSDKCAVITVSNAPWPLNVAAYGIFFNCWITGAGARLEPRPQVLLDIGWTGSDRQVTVTVTSGAAKAQRTVLLHRNNPTGLAQAQSLIIDMPRLSSDILCELSEPYRPLPTPSAIFYLTAESHWPAIHITAASLPAAVSRFLTVYTNDRQATAASPSVLITDSTAALGSAAGIICLTSGQSTASAAPLAVADHAITRGINFSTLTGASSGNRLPIPAWQPIVSAGPTPLIAVRDTPAARQLWIGLPSASWQSWAQSPDFVRFFSAALAWCARADTPADIYTGQRLPPVSSTEEIPTLPPPLVTADVRWSKSFDGPLPGIYPAPDGQRVALNAALPPPPPVLPASPPLFAPPTPEFKPFLVSFPSSSDLQPLLAVAALLLTAAGILALRR